jgi:hypothetical protein
MRRAGACRAASLAMAVACLCGCKANDPNRLCDSAYLDRADARDIPLYRVQPRHEGPTVVIVHQAVAVAAQLISVDRRGECRLDPASFSFHWRFEPEGMVEAGSIRYDEHGSRVEFIPTSLTFGYLVVDVSHPRWGAATGRTAPFLMFTAEQAAMNDLQNDIARIYRYNPLSDGPEPEESHRLRNQLSRAIGAINKDNYALATRQMQEFRSEVVTLQEAEEQAWTAVLARTDAILGQLNSRSSISPPSTDP